MSPIQNPQEITICKTYFMIDDSALSNVAFFGWDMDEKVHAQTLEAVWEPERDGPKESCPDKVKVINASINELNQNLISIIPEFPDNLLYENAADDLMIKFAELSGFILNLPMENHQKFVSIFEQLIKLIIERDKEHIKKFMPIRTKSATLTVQKVAELQAEGKLPLTAIFQFGLEHLKQETQDQDFSLEIFYNEIAKHRAIILFPKMTIGSNT